MNRHEKIAWFNLAVFGVSLVLYIILLQIFREKHGLYKSAIASSGAFALCALCAFSSAIFRNKKEKPGAIIDNRSITEILMFDPDLDERDLMIQRKARWSGFGAIWMVYVFGLMGIWKWARYQGIESISVDITILPLLVAGGALLCWVVSWITTVILYCQDRYNNQPKKHWMTSNRLIIFLCLAFLLLITGLNSITIIRAGLEVGVISIMFAFGIAHLFIWVMHNNPGGILDEGDLLILNIAGWIAGPIFLVLYIMAFVVTLMSYRYYGRFIIIPMFFIFFSTIIILVTMVPMLKKYLRGKINEKA